MSEIVNKVAASGIVTLDPEALLPAGPRVVIDIAEQLWQGLVLREKDFRDWIQAHDWSQYKGAHVAIHCSADAIIPNWAYMLVSAQLAPHANTIVFGDRNQLLSAIASQVVDTLSAEDFRDKRVVVKGCSDAEVPVSMYVDIVRKLQPVVRSLMFGEPCSTVPILKNKI
ncbi:MAG: DUF2480 family protein [Flavobacteriales bacterium]|nr:DUF2480 family protein [Flavobacteriales bacterium]